MTHGDGINGRRVLSWLAGLLALACLSDARAASTASVAMSSPAPGHTFAPPATVTLGATSEGPMLWVDFYQNGLLVGWADAEPFTYEWSGLLAGDYTVEAHAMDASGRTVISSPVQFHVAAQPSLSLTRSPYIMMGHFTNQSSIVWRTDKAADSWVEYGLTTAYGQATGSAGAVIQHEATLANLLPGRTYHYRVSSGGRVLAAAEFPSGKMPGTPVRIAWTSDHRGGRGGPIAAVIRSYKPDLILDPGDLMLTCTNTLLDKEFFSVFAGMLSQSPFYWTPGNHEGDGCAPCLQAFDLLPEDHQSYSIEYGDLQAIALNADDLPSPAWLRQKLATSTKPWKFVFTHAPAYSAAGGHGEWDGLTLRANYVPLMEEYRVAACISGHNHYYWRSQPINGVTHLVAGSGGAPIYDLLFLPPYTAGANDAAQVFAYADLDGDFMHIHAVDQVNTQVDETVIDRRCAFQLDGLLDGSVPLLAQAPGGSALWAGVSGRYLYVATTNAVAEDHFIFLSQTRSDLVQNLGAVWAKDGQVMGYDAFLAGQAGTMSTGWFDSSGQPMGDLRVARSTTRISQDGVLEGVIDLEALYGAIPSVIYLAAAPYTAGPGGVLDPAGQCPAGNMDADIQPDEFLAVSTAAITMGDGRFTGLTLAADGTAVLDFLGDPDALYTIEVSEDLGEWYSIGSQIADIRGWFTFHDYFAGLFEKQFYRARRISPP